MIQPDRRQILTIFALLWAAQQEMRNPTSQTGKLKKLQAQAALFNLLNGNGITTMQQLYEKIAAINTEYYALRGKIVSTERSISKLEEQLSIKKDLGYKEMRDMREQLKAIETLKKAAEKLEKEQPSQSRKKEEQEL